MQTVNISQAMQMNLEQQIKCNSDSGEWKRIMPLIADDLRLENIDSDPVNLPEILAKAYTGDIAGGKGVCVMGYVGSGKSRRMEFFARKTYIKMLSAPEICAEWVELGGNNAISDFMAYLRADGHEELYGGNVPPFYCDLIIDDLGTENERYSSFGIESDVMAQYVIPFRYKVFPKWRTFFTTNLTKQQLKDRYGDRCFSRLNEMCAFIPLTHKDRRLEK